MSNQQSQSLLSSKSMLVLGVLLFVIFFTLISFAKNTIGDILTVQQNIDNDSISTAVRGTGVSDPLVTVVPRDPEQEDTDPVLGKNDASVTIFAFEEFMCFHCREMSAEYAEVLLRYPEDVKLVWKGVVDSKDNDSLLAHEAARCAQDQGVFWEYHDLLFEHQLTISRDVVTELAKKLRINTTQFDNCVDDHIHRSLVLNGEKTGGLLQLTGTPYIIIGDVEFAGVASAEEMIQAVQLALQE